MISDTMPAADLKVGLRVIVFDRGGGKIVRVPCEVTKIGRLYVELTSVDTLYRPWPRTYRMLMSTQAVKSAYSNPDYFRTPAQIEWEQQLAAIDQRIRAHRIVIDRLSPFNAPSSREALADFLDQTMRISQ